MGAPLHPVPGKTGTRSALAGSSLTAAAASLAGLFFPDRCRICQTVLDHLTRVPVCDACWIGVVTQSQEDICEICGIPQLCAGAEPGPGPCPNCTASRPQFLAARSYAAYGGNLRELLHFFKYGGIEPLATPLGRRIAAVAAQHPEIFGRCNAVVAVPLDASRQRERKYNQAALLAKVAARELGLPLLPASALRRTRATPPQSGLSRPERQENMKGAFAAKSPPKGMPERILLIDDVMTTGATLDACAAALLAAGAREVVALTVARTPSHEIS